MRCLRPVCFAAIWHWVATVLWKKWNAKTAADVSIGKILATNMPKATHTVDIFCFMFRFPVFFSFFSGLVFFVLVERAK